MLLVGPFDSRHTGLLTFMADESTQTGQGTNQSATTTANESTSTTSSADGQQAADSTTGAATQTAQSTEASEKTDTTKTETEIDENSPKFKAALTRAIQAKLPQLQKQARRDVAKELSGEQEGEPTVEQLKSQIDGANTELRRYRARDQVEDFVGDKRNQLQVRNMKALIRYVEHQFEYDDNGKVTNLKELLTAAKLEVPELFGGQSSSIDAGNGARQQPALDMNAWMRGK